MLFLHDDKVVHRTLAVSPLGKEILGGICTRYGATMMSVLMPLHALCLLYCHRVSWRTVKMQDQDILASSRTHRASSYPHFHSHHINLSS